MLATVSAAALLGAPAGGLAFDPAESIDTAAITVRTSAGCPEPADSYHAVARGHGFPVDGQVVTAPTGAGLSRAEGFDVYFAQTMKDFATDNRTTLDGPYDVTVYCTNGFSGEVFATFSGSLTFTTPTTYRTGDVLAAAPPAAESARPPVGWIAAATAVLLAFETGRRYGRRSTTSRKG
ncbi:hypothetical protein AB0M02_33640 [Actinoplanes sp. NPDC051861]|uniref:hypothetical protein n=1 Tax=Actinoplanes sp. NPDC051861 TaxID=3155170 RepID=UPI00341D9DF0